MAKFSGMVGFGDSQETSPASGIWEDVMTQHPYRGDVIRDTSKLEASDYLNDDITVANSISIMADQYANDNYPNIKYVEWGGVRWTVTTVEVKRPRLVLSIGDVYNGPTPD